jgi:hypothetical protein
MTSLTPRWRKGRLAVRVALVAAFGALLLVGCAPGAPAVHLPPRAQTPSARAAAASAQRTLSPRQQVIAAYLGYTTAMTDAFNSRSPDRVKQLLKAYLDAATVRNAIHAFSQAWAKDEISYGRVERHIIGVRIHGTAAWVHDCDNTSGSGLEYATTNQIVPGSLGTPHDNLVTRLNLVRRRWVVWVQTIEDVPCAP